MPGIFSFQRNEYSKPLLIAIGALVIAGETLAPPALVGVLCLASGVMVLTFEKGGGIRKNPGAIAYAVLTGGFIACYTVVERRVSGSDALCRPVL